MAIDKQDYIDLITSQYQNSPKFLAWLGILFQIPQDIAYIAEGMDLEFDIDHAIGDQLDVVGELVGLNRNLEVLIYNSDVGFTWDDANLGWDAGVWVDTTKTTVVRLDDDTYRIALKIKIAANSWNGTIPHAYEIWTALFGVESQMGIQNNCDMTMDLLIAGTDMANLLYYLFSEGYISFHPALGVPPPVPLESSNLA